MLMEGIQGLVPPTGVKQALGDDFDDYDDCDDEDSYCCHDCCLIYVLGLICIISWFFQEKRKSYCFKSDKKC